MDLIVRNARLVTNLAAGPVDIGIAGGTIAAIEKGLAAEAEVYDAGRRREGKSRRRRADANPRILHQTGWQRPVRNDGPVNVKIESFDAAVAGGQRIKTAYLTGTIDPEGFDADGDTKGIRGGCNDVGVSALG